MNALKHIKRFVFILLFQAMVCPLVAQSVVVTKAFQLHPVASAMALYKNQFGQWEKPDLDITFPYAVIRMHLDGNAHEVTTAKQRITLYMGTQTAVIDVYKENSNEILFLVPARRPLIFVDCGDGCERVVLSENQQLQPNGVYDCAVHFLPEEEYMMPTTMQAPKRQYFKFFVSPANANVRVQVDGAWQWWPVKDGMASKSLDYGKYNYEVSAESYKMQSGTIVVSDRSQQLEIELQPTFGWLSIVGDDSAKGAYVYATNTATSVSTQLGRLPIPIIALEDGTYQIDVQKDNYTDYTTVVAVSMGDTVHISPRLGANFGQVQLKEVSSQSQIYLDNQLLARGYWQGPLEYGTYSIESRKDNHYSAYTTIEVVESSEVQEFTLNPPIPITGSLAVEGNPAMGTIYIDDKMEGESPMIISPLLVGKHIVRIEKEGYQSEIREIVIEENKEQLIEYTLTKLSESVNDGDNATPQLLTQIENQIQPNEDSIVKQNEIAFVEEKKKTIDSLRQTNTMVLLNAGSSFKSQLWGVGLMFGQLYNGYGWYVKGRSNFQALPECAGVCDADFEIDGVEPFYSGNTKASKWIINAGFAMDFLAKREKKNKNNLFGMYLGAGYGSSLYALETTDKRWITYSPWSKQGVSVDIGLLGSISGFTIAAGVNTINFKYYEAELSIGWTF